MKVYAWGLNLMYQCGTGDLGDVLHPSCIESVLKIVKIKAGPCHSTAITQDGKYLFWGSNLFNQCLDLKTAGLNLKRPTAVFQDKHGKIIDIFFDHKVTRIILSGEHSLETSKGRFKSGCIKVRDFFVRLGKKKEKKEEKQNVKCILCAFSHNIKV